MLFSELLDAVKALPRDEQVQPMQSIQEEVGTGTPEELLLGKEFQPGRSFDVWFPESNPEAVAAALLALQIGEHGGA